MTHAPECLDGVGEGVEAGDHRDKRRNRHCQRRVNDAHIRIKARVVGRLFFSPAADDGNARHLRAGASRCWNGKDFYALFAERSTVKMRIRRLFAFCAGCRKLRRVHSAAAAQSKHSVSAGLFQQTHRLLHAGKLGIRLHIVKHSTDLIAGVQQLGAFRRKKAVADQHALLHAAAFQQGRQLVQLPEAEHDLGGQSVVEGINHRSCPPDSAPRAWRWSATPCATLPDPAKSLW